MQLNTLFTSIIVMGLVAPRAFAQQQTIGDILKHIEKRSEKVSFKKKTHEALPAIHQEKPKKAVINLQQVRPPSSSRLYYPAGTDEAALEETTDESINQLYQLAKEYRSSPRRGELWLRLGEQYVDKARLIEYRLMSEHDRAQALYEQGKGPKPPPVDLTAARNYNRKALELYEWFVRDFPKDPKEDQALFFLGFNFFELGDTKKGETYYLRLSNEYPNSMYVAESNFALGEYYFENNEFKPALTYYGRVAANRHNRLYSFSMYKMAWCYYKLNQSKSGMKYLEQVILDGRRAKGEHDRSIGGVSRIRLATEAIKDLIVFFAEAGDPRAARSYFSRVIGPRSTDVNLEKLGYFYIDIGNRDAALYVFRDLIAEHPNSVKAFDYQYAIVKTYSQSGNPKIFHEELHRWIQQFGPKGLWQMANRNNPQVITKANQLMESLLRNHVLLNHEIAQKTHVKAAYLRAQAGYELYFHTFQQGPEMDQMHFFYGELLYDLQEYNRAAVHYTWVVDNSPKSPYYNKALLNALLAYEKRLPSDAQIRRMVGSSTTYVPFTPPITRFEEAAKTYLVHSPKGSDVVAVKYRLGALYYLFNHFDDAITYLTDIVHNYPNTPYARYAANHLLDIYNLKKDYTGLEREANEILSIPALAHSNIGPQVRQIKTRTEFNMVKDIEKKKDYAGAAKSYQQFARNNPRSDLAAPALFNSAVNYERANEILPAIGIYSTLAAGHAIIRGKVPPDMRRKSSEFLPVLYEKTGQYPQAARAYEAYAAENPKAPLALEYRYNAAVIYDGLNDYSPAIRNYQIYFNKKRGGDRIETLFLMGKLYQRLGQPSQAIREFNQYLQFNPHDRAGVVEATFDLATLEDQLGNHKSAEKWYHKTVAVQKRLTRPSVPVGVSFAAQAKYKLVYPTYQELVAIRMPKNPAKQKSALTRKIAILNQLRAQLKTVINYNDGPEIVSALTLLGEALQNMYTTIVTAPVPGGLKPSEVEQYRALLQQKAEPFKTEALETYQTAITKGSELQAYTPTLTVALKNLSVMKGESHVDLGTRAMAAKLTDTMGL